MFERYTEKARRVIFFARYEASQYYSSFIETEHILLGLLREDKWLFIRLLPSVTFEAVRTEVDKHTVIEHDSTKRPLSVDLPLSDESKRVLAYSAEEAERFSHKHIGTEHLLLGLLREPKSPGGLLLLQGGANLDTLRQEIKLRPHNLRNERWSGHPAAFHPDPRDYRSPVVSHTVQIHGSRYNIEYIRERVKACREFFWHWDKHSWTARDIMVNGSTGAMSFDLNLADKENEFDVLKGGWRKDYCYVCRWELFESVNQPEHGTAYTNGRDWICSECFEKFMSDSDFFSSNYPEIT